AKFSCRPCNGATSAKTCVKNNVKQNERFLTPRHGVSFRYRGTPMNFSTGSLALVGALVCQSLIGQVSFNFSDFIDSAPTAELIADFEGYAMDNGITIVSNPFVHSPDLTLITTNTAKI